MMNIGKLDRRIRIERLTGARDATYNTPLDVWETYWEGWANLEEQLPSKGGALPANGIEITARTTRARLRFIYGVTSAMRVVYLDRDNRLMKITSVPVEMGRKEGLEFMLGDFTTTGNAT